MLGQILAHKKVPYVSADGHRHNIGIDAAQTRYQHNVFRHCWSQFERGLLFGARICFSTRKTQVRFTKDGPWTELKSRCTDLVRIQSFKYECCYIKLLQ